MKTARIIRIIINVSRSKLVHLRITDLLESKIEKIGKYSARRDAPHFQGDEYHGHCDLQGGHQVSWTASGTRRHPSKFPAGDKIPRDAKAAVAKVLGVEPNTLEAFIGYDAVEGKEVFILQERVSS